MSPFGGFDLSNASTFGIGGRHGGWDWNLNFTASQGSSYSNVSTTPFLTLPNGGFGFINDTVQRPFVTSFVPVVNGQTFEQRQAVLRHFEDSANRYLQEHRIQQQRETAELEQLRRESAERIARNAGRSGKTDDPPLVLGTQQTSTGFRRD